MFFLGVKFLVNFCLIVFAAVLAAVALLLLYEALRAFGIRRLTYRRYFSSTGVFEGESLEMIEEVTNHMLLPIIRVDIESYVSSKIKMEGYADRNELMQHFISSFSVIMPRTTIRRHHPCTAEKRGYYRLESAQIMLADYDIFLKSEAELYVYPAELKMREEEAVQRYLQLNAPSKLPLIADRFSFAGVREYRTTDSMNSVNFKATARHGRLMVNDTEFLMGRKIKIYLNFQPDDHATDLDEFRNRMEEALKYIAYLCGRAEREGNRFGIGSNSHMEGGAYYINIPIGSGVVHYQEVMKELAKIQNYEGNSFISVIDMDLFATMTDAEVYILTSYVDEGIEDRIGKLRSLGNTVKVVQV
ncbi:MAG: DUF58 domain-containing protein [Lachnospiraceae bacterium]|nr:DUF58 domain-containing protein [Lachnospiraceae bacterium]